MVVSMSLPASLRYTKALQEAHFFSLRARQFHILLLPQCHHSSLLDSHTHTPSFFSRLRSKRATALKDTSFLTACPSSMSSPLRLPCSVCESKGRRAGAHRELPRKKASCIATVVPSRLEKEGASEVSSKTAYSCTSSSFHSSLQCRTSRFHSLKERRHSKLYKKYAHTCIELLSHFASERGRGGGKGKDVKRCIRRCTDIHAVFFEA